MRKNPFALSAAALLACALAFSASGAQARQEPQAGLQTDLQQGVQHNLQDGEDGQAFISEQEVAKLMRRTAAMLATPPQASDRALVREYRLDALPLPGVRGAYFGPTSEEEAQYPSTTPIGFYLYSPQGLVAFAGWQGLQKLMPKARCRRAAHLQRAYICTARGVAPNSPDIRRFDRELHNMMISAN